MKRLLVTTTALAVALSGINPAMLRAQDDVQMVCPADIGPGCAPEQMVPKKKKKKKSDTQAEPEQKLQPAPVEEPAPEPPKKKKQQDEPAQPKKKADPDGQTKQKKPKKTDPEVQAVDPQTPILVPAPEPGVVPQPDTAVTDPAVTDPAVTGTGDTTGKGKKKPKATEAPVETTLPDGSTGADETDQAKKAGKPRVKPELQPSAGVAMPPETAVDALDSIVSSEPARRSAGDTADKGRGRPAKPAAAAEKADAGKVEMKITKAEKRRRSSEDFQTGAGEDQKADKDHNGGLSDLEKAGLVVLGALVVGSLLNNGNRVVSNTGDRVVVDRGDGQYMLLKDDDALIRYPGSDVQTETFVDGSTRTTVMRSDGTSIVTIRDASGRVLRRALVYPDGRQTLLIDDLDESIQPVDLRDLPRPTPGGLVISTSDQDAGLQAEMYRLRAGETGRAYSLQQIRDYPELRALAPTFDVADIAFATGSAAIDPAEAQKLSTLGGLMRQMIDRNPAEMFLVEGHTDAVGGAAMNLALSDRRAESLALALSEYFGVPAENMVVQGYGESELLVPTEAAEPRNRRALVRMISPLMRQVAQQ